MYVILWDLKFIFSFSFFCRYIEDKRKYPTLWHQCLLTFVQIYKDNLSVEQKNMILELIKVQRHILLSIKISRELHNFYSENSSNGSDSDD